MRFSRALIPTVKEAPSDASNVSHILLTRAGYIRRVGAGMYDFLPLGVRVLNRVATIVREEMNRALAEEILMPVLLPAEYFQESGRWDSFGDTLFRLKDRKGTDFHLGPTHEEIVTDIARREIKSYRDMPKNLYQVQTKFRDEARPRGGLLRCREFLMKDAYSFDVSEEKAKESYEAMRKAYVRIFDRLGLRYRMVQADSGSMGGSTSAEFQVLVDSGEDAIVACDECEYAANVEVAATRHAAPARTNETFSAISRVSTPGKKTIAEVAEFLNRPKEKTLKALLYTVGKEIVMLVIRGDHEVNEIKLARALNVPEVFLATDADVLRVTGSPVGYVGPVNFKGTLYVDRGAAEVMNGICGANEVDTHLTGVNFGHDYKGTIVEVRMASTGDGCPNCATGKLVSYKGIEGGHIFILGTHYTAKMSAQFLDEAGERKPIVMGCYGIGVSRLVATTIEQHNDADGIAWPMSIAPYHVHLCTIGADEAVTAAGEKLHAALAEKGIEVLWDDRDERPGVKFKDADLIGIPIRVVLGGKGLAAGQLELKLRSERDPKKIEMIALEGAADELARRVHAMLKA